MHLCRDVNEIEKTGESRTHVASEPDEGLVIYRWSPRSDMKFGDNEEVEHDVYDETSGANQ